MQTKPLGFVLIVAGIILIACTSFDFVTTKKVIDLGAVQINKQQNHHVEWPPVLGAVLLLGGVVAILFNKNTPA